jgi:hypothetical protein
MWKRLRIVVVSMLVLAAGQWGLLYYGKWKHTPFYASLVTPHQQRSSVHFVSLPAPEIYLDIL